MAILHPKPVRHFKTIFRSGVNPASGNFPVGSKAYLKNKGKKVR